MSETGDPSAIVQPEPESADVLSGALPDLGEDEAARILSAHWGLDGVRLSRLGSERDLNYRVDSDRGRFVLKMANQAEPLAVTRLQTQALVHVAATDPSVPVPRVIPTTTGETDIQVESSTVRLLSWMDGIPWHLARRGKAQRQAIATCHARLARALASLGQLAPPAFLQWDVQHAGLLADMIDSVEDRGQRDLVRAGLERFLRHSEPALPALRRQYGHNDIQPHNVVVSEADPDQMGGILDFGDLVWTALACDLGVAGAYHVLPGDHPLETLGEYVSAFHAVMPLEAPEIEVLPGLVMARHVTTIVIADRRARSHPENVAYIMRNVPTALGGLAQMLSASQEEAVAYLGSVLS